METMAVKGSPRDMNKWAELLRDPNVQFPGESSEYRRARNQLLESEAEERRHHERCVAWRRSWRGRRELDITRPYRTFRRAARGHSAQGVLVSRHGETSPAGELRRVPVEALAVGLDHAGLPVEHAAAAVPVH